MLQRNERKAFFIRSSFARLAHRLTVLIILLWSSCFSELRSEDGYSPARIKFCYDTEKEGYRLNTTAYKVLHALSGTDCAVHCVHDHCCRSVNYRKDPVYNGNENCELLYTVASEQPENLKPDRRYDYYLLLEPERSFDCNCSGCENDGTCQRRSNCSCLAGFSGKRCEKEDKCGNCDVNGKCENGKCVCNPGYVGQGTSGTCKLVLPPTNPPPAGLASPRTDPRVGIAPPLYPTSPVGIATSLRPTTPVGMATSFHSTTPVGMATSHHPTTPVGMAPPPGSTQLAKTYCHPSPCLNGGDCIEILNGYKCKCASHFRGTNCQDVDECITSPCHQNTTCNNTLGSYKCSCRHGDMVNRIRCEESLYSSKILGGDCKYLKQLYQWLNNETKWKLCYRASEHGWRAGNFHSNCDGKGQTVTIVRVDDYIFGGYSDVDWKGLKGTRNSSKAFLFSLRNKDNLQPFKSSVRSNCTTYAIHTGPQIGPTFGRWVFGGGYDLHIDPNSHTSTTSQSNLGNTYQLPPGYSYGTAKTQQLLAGSSKFRICEIEVYHLY